MPTYDNSKLPPLSSAVVQPLKVAKTVKAFPSKFQEPSVKVNLPDRTAKFISLGAGKKQK